MLSERKLNGISVVLKFNCSFSFDRESEELMLSTHEGLFSSILNSRRL